MTEEEIVNSQAFKAINLLIKQKVDELKFNIHCARDACKLFSDPQTQFPSSVNTRVSYEENGRFGGGEIELDADLTQMTRVIDCFRDIEKIKSEIGELQRFKLRLLNDYDFTHGDDGEQREVFG